MNFAAVILAAGLSTRMGEPKQFLHIAGKPMVLYSVDAALQSGLSPVVVVTGQHFEGMSRCLADKPVQLLKNPDYRSGLASSLTTGIRWLLDTSDSVTWDGAMVLLADQPFLSSALISRLTSTYEQKYETGTRIVRPQYEGVEGNPVLFARDFLPLLLDASGDKGARDIIVQHRSELQIVPVNEPHQGMDIDTRSDLQKARQIVVRKD